MVDQWPNEAIREEFFGKLRQLIAEYPNLADRMARDEAESGICDCDPAQHPKFDPSSPVYLQGLVLVISHANMDHFEDISILAPPGQSTFMTKGLIASAKTLEGA